MRSAIKVSLLLGVMALASGCPRPNPGGTGSTSSSGGTVVGVDDGGTTMTGQDGGVSSSGSGGSSSGSGASSSSAGASSSSGGGDDGGMARVGPTRFEIGAGGARMTNGTLRMDAQLGHPVVMQRSASGSVVLEGAPVVAP